jgi:hypothetical protein
MRVCTMNRGFDFKKCYISRESLKELPIVVTSNTQAHNQPIVLISQPCPVHLIPLARVSHTSV